MKTAAIALLIFVTPSLGALAEGLATPHPEDFRVTFTKEIALTWNGYLNRCEARFSKGVKDNDGSDLHTSCLLSTQTCPESSAPVLLAGSTVTTIAQSKDDSKWSRNTYRSSVMFEGLKVEGKTVSVTGELHCVGGLSTFFSGGLDFKGVQFQFSKVATIAAVAVSTGSPAVSTGAGAVKKPLLPSQGEAAPANNLQKFGR